MKFFRVPKLEDDTVEIKLKFRSKSYQSYPGLAKHACYAYWRLGSGFFWKNAGIIERQNAGKPVAMLPQEHIDKLLLLAEQRVRKIINENNSLFHLSIPVKDIVS